MSAALGRLKRGVRAAVSGCGGIDGAAATAGRRRSVAGDWNNLNHDAYPPMDCAFALDEVCIAQGLHPPILAALTLELDHVVVRLPAASAGDEGLTSALIKASADFGDIASEVHEATRDGVIDAREREQITHKINTAIEALVRLRIVAGGQ